MTTSVQPDMLTAPAGPDGRRISPTVISQFVRLDQCRRFLRLALHQSAVNGRFMRDYGVASQAIPPLLTRSGAEFERRVEAAAAAQYDLRNLGRAQESVDRPTDNEQVITAARELPPGEVVIFLQARLRAQLADWDLVGDADIVRLERDAQGALQVLVADIKSTTTAKVEHRLQVAFYRDMLERLFSEADVAHAAMQTGILYRGAEVPADDKTEADAALLAEQRGNAERLFGVKDGLLELTPDPHAYRDAVRDMVTNPDSFANQAVAAPFADIPWHLTYKCDGCLYNEFCMKWAAEHDDLSLLPHLTDHEKRGLGRAGIATAHDLAILMEPTPDPVTHEADLTRLRPAPGREAEVSRLSRTWPLGARLEELVHRARRYRAWQGDEIAALPYIPSKGYGSLPFSSPEQNPNLVRVFIDAQHDYLQDRVYLLGALVVGNTAGAPDPQRRRTIVELAPGPPDDDLERDLLLRWTDQVIRAVVELAAPDAADEPTAPIHLIFYNSFEQKLLLQLLGRHAERVLTATPLYDFMTQLAAFDSPVVTVLETEIREQKNYPMVCQSLQAVASMISSGGERFDWNTPEPFRERFRERLFDSLGRFGNDGGTTGAKQPWATRRARFNSQIPLEYAYAAWDALPSPPAAGNDPYGPYRQATRDLLLAFEAKRLAALEHVANDFRGNRDSTKSSFVLPDLASFSDVAPGLAAALQEFVAIERHVELAAWKSARLAAPERRVLVGETLLVRYLEEDQPPGLVAVYQENARRQAAAVELRAAHMAAHPEAKRWNKTPEEKELTAQAALPDLFRLRLDVSDSGISVNDALALSTIKAGDRVVVQPRWTFDTRLPEAEQKPLTPTPKQMLYGMRHEIAEIETESDASGVVLRAWLRTEPAPSFGNGEIPGFLFRGHDVALNDGELYSIDPDPNSIYAYWSAKVVRDLLVGARNELHRRVSKQGASPVDWPEAAQAGQTRFMAGLQAMHAANAAVAFEASKVAYIGSHGDAPLLLVQGPPGTGKSFTTAFAILARLQGAMAAGMPCRALIGAKTHAATDVLLEAVRNALDALAGMRASQPEIFADYFDARLLILPLFRIQPREETLPDVTALYAGSTKRPKGQARPFDVLAGEPYAVVAATPGGVYAAETDSKAGLFGNELFDLLVLDEASQLSLPESLMAALPLRSSGQIVTVGDHRQMAPIVKHDWEREARRTFQDFAVYRSLFDTVRGVDPTTIQFAESFRLERNTAEYLRRTVYVHDGLPFHSARDGELRATASDDAFVAAILDPQYPLVVVVHDEASSQLRNDFERDLTAPLLSALHAAGYDASDGFGMVVTHRSQRASVQDALRRWLPAGNSAEIVGAVDTVERFQGGERRAIIVSATESDPAYLLATGAFLFNPRRLTVAISRAKDKVIVVAGRSVFEMFSPDEELFASAQIWKDLLRRTCTIPCWSGERLGQQVEVWGNPPLL